MWKNRRACHLAPWASLGAMVLGSETAVEHLRTFFWAEPNGTSQKQYWHNSKAQYVLPMLAPDVRGHFSTDHDMAASRDKRLQCKKSKHKCLCHVHQLVQLDLLFQNGIPIHQLDYTIDWLSLSGIQTWQWEIPFKWKLTKLTLGNHLLQWD